MKIHSKFYDYYDKMKCHTFCGEDMAFVRKTEEIEVELEKFREFRHYRDYDVVRNEEIEHFLIGFCGHYYLCLVKSNDDKGVRKPNYHYNMDEILDIKYVKESVARQKWFGFGVNYHNKTSEQILEIANKKFVEKEQTCNDELKIYDLFKKHNTPILIIKPHPDDRNKYIVIKNPNLMEIQFSKIKDGFQTYQEIDMYLGNELCPRDDPDQITDSDVLAKSHGFNEWSFRKTPGENTKARKQKKRRGQKND